MLADFHIHSTFSDGKHSIPELIDAYGTRGFGCISITDHLCETETVIGRFATYLGRSLTPATFPLYLEILKSEARRAWIEYGMVVIPGVELTKNSVLNHRSAHIIALGIEGLLCADGDAVDICRSIRRHGGLAIAAHPVSTRKTEKQTYELWGRREELAPEFDAWEVASGPYLFDEVLESGLPMIASSDLHSLKQMTSWKTVLSCERHPEAVLNAIRKQKVKFQFYRDEVGNDGLDHRIDSSALGISHGSHSLRHFIIPETLKVGTAAS